MKTSTIFVLLLLLTAFSGIGQAAVIGNTVIPPTINGGESFDVLFGVMPENGEEITGFQFDVLFSEFLTPAEVTELGYFAGNGIFFFPGIPGTGSLAFISDALGGGDFLPGTNFDFLFRIRFTAAGAGPLTPSVTISDPIITLSNGSEATISAVLSDVPEPATMVLTAAAAVAGLLARRLRGSRA